MASVYNFGDIYEMKKFIMEDVAPKYFDIDDINQFNVGLLGYTTETLTVVTEESFNALNTMFKEIFISKATFPETIYAKAGVLGIDNMAAQAAFANIVLFIKKDDIINNGEFDGDVFDFVLDKNTRIDVAEIPFSLDYDIHVIARPEGDDFTITAQYDLSTENSISTISHQHIRVYRTKMDDGAEYVALFINARQYERVTQDENLISSNTINFPTVNVEYSDMYAGMDVLYKAPNSETYVPLTTRISGSTPLKTPFIFYTHKDQGTIELSFTTRDNYFKPEFNSELKVIVYTTKGKSGNYKEYNGTDISVVGYGENYEYNSRIVMYATTIGSSTEGRDMKTLEDLRDAIIERDSTSGAYNTETDLETYFNNATNALTGVFLKFIKRRDDLVERLFSCFGIFKDVDGDYYNTNTLNLKITEDQFDHVYDGGNRFILNPGTVLIYDGNSTDTVEVYDGTSDCDFKFASPFLISMQKNPNSVTLYNNSVDSKHSLEYKFNEYTSKYQFIVNSINVSRNSVIGENGYTVRTTIKPTFEFELNDDGIPDFDEDVKLLLTVDEDGVETKAMPMNMVDIDAEQGFITYEYIIESTDEISSNERVVITNAYDVEKGGDMGYNSIPMFNLVLNLCFMAKDDTITSVHNFNDIGYSDYKLISRYGTDTEKVTLVQPMKNMRCRVKFHQYAKGVDEESGDPIHDYYALISLLPVVSDELLLRPDKLSEFLKEVNYTYDQLKAIMEMKTNNYSLDVKFYNTYGKSKNFIVGENKEVLDRTNISVKIQVAFAYGTIISDAIDEIKRYIKDYVENINKSKSQTVEYRGYNGIYVSNLIQELENNFEYIRYMKFVSINNYNSTVQVVENATVDVTTLSDSERRSYVPEFLTISPDEIIVEVL